MHNFPCMTLMCAVLVQTSKIAAAFIAALLLLVIFWSRKVFTVVMCLVFVAAIIGCYFIPNPAGGEIMRYFILFVGCAPKSMSISLYPCLTLPMNIIESGCVPSVCQAAINAALCIEMR